MVTRIAFSPARSVALAIAGYLALASPSALAAPTKDECVDMHSRGQDARDKGQLSQARQHFVACGQSSCPSLIQADCVRFGEELERLVPTLSFAARDSKQNDLPDTSVYVDNVLAVSRLDEGRPTEIDPGRHSVRFVHGSQETTLTVVVNQGEKGRLIVGTFPEKRTAGSEGQPSTVGDTSAGSRSAVPLVVAGVGGAALVAGGAIAIVGLGKVPSNCAYSTKECAAAPGDPSFSEAHKGASTVNVGLIVGGAGAAMLAGGLVWYFLTPTKVSQVGVVSPWATPLASGVSFTRAF